MYTKELTKTTKDVWKRNDKIALIGSLSFCSAIQRCALFVLSPIGAEVAWHAALRSLPCHM